MKEKLTRKNIIIGAGILVVLIIIGIAIVLINHNKSDDKDKVLKGEENGIKYNTNEKVIEDKTVDGITFTKFECSFDGNNSLITYVITNKNQNTVNLGEYELTVKDKDGNILTTIVPNFDYDLKVDETYEMGNSVNIDLTEAYSIEIELDNKKNVD